MCDKVFCVNCQYFNGCKKATPCNTTYDADNIHEQCNAPKNIRATYKSDESDKYISTPAIINKFNNCGWFIAKGLDQDIHYLLNKHNIDPESHEPILKLIQELDRRVTILEEANKIKEQEDQPEGSEFFINENIK